MEAGPSGRWFLKIVFLLEERSAANFLEQFLPRWRPDVEFVCIPHEGKSDLERSIPRKLRGWRCQEDLFVVLRDNDGTPCEETKARLVRICVEAGRPDTLVRLACQELEAWFLGDLKAVGSAYGLQNLAKHQGKAKFREPDRLGSPSAELAKLAPEYKKLHGSKLLGKTLNLDINENSSKSFRVFFSGLKRLCQ